MVNNEVSMPPSPWKKPKIVSLAKTKSFKRKSEIFNINSTNEGPISNGSKFQSENELNIINEEQQASKERKTIINRFSIRSSLSFNSAENNLTAIVSEGFAADVGSLIVKYYCLTSC